MTGRLAAVLCALAVVMLAAACGGDGDASAGDPSPDGQDQATATPTSSSTADPGNGHSEPVVVEGPASKYAVSQDDLGRGYITDIEQTFVLDAATYGQTSAFKDEGDGEALLRSWGYISGYETHYEPEGRLTAVLNGAYYLWVETHLFETEEGAKKAFEFFNSKLATTSQPVNADRVGDESSAWRLIYDKVPNSTVDAAFHRVVVRRGNLVAIVATWGAEPFMRADHAIGWAKVIDEKALGTRQAIEPTPTSNYNPNQ